jgi:hypothetical protein
VLPSLLVALGLAGWGASGAAPSGPTATATPTVVVPTATPTPAVADPLTSPISHHWPTDPPSCQFVSGGYQVHANHCASSILADDGTITVDVTPTQEDSPSGRDVFGVTFRELSGEWHGFGITTDGNWAFFKAGHSPTIIATDSNPAIMPGLNVTNTLTVTFTGSHFEFLVDGSTDGQADDGTLAGLGQIGLNATGNGIAVFANFQYYA